MVRVWRGVAEPSSFLVAVAESGESIEIPRTVPNSCPAFLFTLHQTGRRRKLAEAPVENAYSSQPRVRWNSRMKLVRASTAAGSTALYSETRKPPTER